MSEREQAMELLKEIPDYKMGYVVAYLRGAAIPEEIPNEETRAFNYEEKEHAGNIKIL